MHYHLQAVTGKIVTHVHTTPRKAHEHDGLRRYATTMKAIEKQREDYLEMRARQHAENIERANRRRQARGQS